MGPPGLNKILATCGEDRNLTDFAGKKIAVDIHNKFYQYGIGIRDTTGDDLRNHRGEVVNHLYTICKYVLFLIDLGIQPVIVFDGKPPDQKRQTLDYRSMRKHEAIKKCNKINDKTSREYIRNFKRSYMVRPEQIFQCKRLLSAMGIPYVQAPGEADSQCSALTHHPEIEGVISDDFDLTVFGAT